MFKIGLLRITLNAFKLSARNSNSKWKCPFIVICYNAVTTLDAASFLHDRDEYHNPQYCHYDGFGLTIVTASALFIKRKAVLW